MAAERYDLYYIENNVNGKLYIGQTTCGIIKRWGQHRTSKKKGKLYQAIKKYGTESFTIQLIGRFENRDELNRAEEFVIKSLDTMNTGYNILAGGGNFDRIAKNGQLLSFNRQVEEYTNALQKSKGVERFKAFLDLLPKLNALPDVNVILKDWSKEEKVWLEKQTLKELFYGWPRQREQAAEGLFWLTAFKKGLVGEEPCLTRPHLKKAV